MDFREAASARARAAPRHVAARSTGPAVNARPRSTPGSAAPYPAAPYPAAPYPATTASGGQTPGASTPSA
ncbi:hypothetical protein SUDANB108_06490 [Streptomyces sp. enrichment culture]